VIGKKTQVLWVAYQVPVGVARKDLLQDPLFAGFKDAGWRHPNLWSCGSGSHGTAMGRVKGCHRFAVFFWILEVAVNRGDTAAQRSF
jgi:hypothetical protein